MLEQHGMNVSLEMIHGDQWLVEREGQSLGEADADQQSARQSWPLRDGNGIDGPISLSGFSQSLTHHRNQGTQDARAKLVPEPLLRKADEWRSATRPRSTESALPERTTAAPVSSQDVSMPRMYASGIISLSFSSWPFELLALAFQFRRFELTPAFGVAFAEC